MHAFTLVCMHAFTLICMHTHVHIHIHYTYTCNNIYEYVSQVGSMAGLLCSLMHCRLSSSLRSGSGRRCWPGGKRRGSGRDGRPRGGQSSCSSCSCTSRPASHSGRYSMCIYKSFNFKLRVKKNICSLFTVQHYYCRDWVLTEMSV